MSEYPYRGWIPTANGRLSFRHVGEAHHPSLCVSANVIVEGSGRRVLAYQKRNLSDVLFGAITEYFCNVQGQFWFALSCKSNNLAADQTTALIGEIYVVKSKADWRTSELSGSVRPAIQALNRLRMSLDPGRHALMGAKHRQAEKSLQSNADIVMRFRLHRDGVLEISDPRFKDSDLEHASNDYAKSTGHDFSKWACDQAYFFLRDICHTHQHHSPKVDTLLILQKFDGNEARWRNNILYSLHYYAIRVRRADDSLSLYQALGVLAYAKSFYDISARALAQSSIASELAVFNLDSICESLRARVQEEESRALRDSTAYSIRLAKVIGARTLIFAVIAVVVAVAAILIQPRIGNEQRLAFPGLNAASDVAAEYFVPLLWVLAILGALAFVLFRTGSVRSRRIGRDFFALMLVKRKASAIVLLLGAAVVLSIAALVFWVDLLEMAEAVGALVDAITGRYGVK